MGEKGAVVGKQQICDEFSDGFRACEETPKGEETAICSETVMSLFASLSMILKQMKNNVRARTHSCLTPSEMGKLSDSDPLCFT